MEKTIESLSEEHISSALANTPFFSGLDRESLKSLSRKFISIFIEADSVLMNEGDLGDSVYLVNSGRLRVIKNRMKDNQEILREVGVGELIGEFALLTGEPRNAAVIAMRDSVLLKLSKSAFVEFIQDHPLQLLDITKDSILHLLYPQKPKKNNIVTIVVTPAGQDFLSYHDFVQQLTEELSKIAPTLHLNYKKLPLGVVDDPLHLSRWLNEQETNFRYIIYETDSVYSSWTQLCIRQGDQVLSVSSATSSPRLNAIEEQIFSANESLQKDVDLILTHPSSVVSPNRTDSWISNRRLNHHHHIKENISADYARLVRYLTGRSVALVLSGGGARGLAQIGTYKAIIESGIPIDMIAGTSFGSVIGALIAKGLSIQEIEDLTLKYMVNASLFDYTLPITSIVGGKKARKNLIGLYGENFIIEDLWVPFFCVSTNISEYTSYVHDKGLLWKSIRASLSIPSMFPPVSQADGCLLIDGGIVNNMPVDIMQKSMKGGKIIAVSVSKQNQIRSTLFSEGVYSGWNALFSRSVKTSNSLEKVPTMVDIVEAAIGLAGSYHFQLMSLQADLFIDLKVDQYGIFDLKAFRELVEKGYQETLLSLKDFVW